MPRPHRPKFIAQKPCCRRFAPQDAEPAGVATLTLEELEALRLADHQGLDQETAAGLMGVSRPTFGRVLARARRAVATSLVEGLSLEIQGGAYQIAPEGRRWRGGGGGGGMGGGGRGQGRGPGRGRGGGRGRRGGGPNQAPFPKEE